MDHRTITPAEYLSSKRNARYRPISASAISMSFTADFFRKSPNAGPDRLVASTLFSGMPHRARFLWCRSFFQGLPPFESFEETMYSEAPPCRIAVQRLYAVLLQLFPHIAGIGRPLELHGQLDAADKIDPQVNPPFHVSGPRKTRQERPRKADRDPSILRKVYHPSKRFSFLPLSFFSSSRATATRKRSA